MKKQIIKHKLKEMEEHVSLVEDNFPDNLKNFEDLGLIKDGIYKRIEGAIENVIDVCSIFNSELNLGIPREEEDFIDNVFSKGIISKKLYLRIKEMKGFRNILVHRYGEIDDKLAYGSIKEGLKDFDLFIKEIKVFLDKN